MTMKLEEFLALKQGEHPVMHYVGRFNHLSQYAIEYVNTDRKKKNHFLRGLNTKLQTMMATCGNATYHETINIAIASEENYRRHKEAKKKNIYFRIVEWKASKDSLPSSESWPYAILPTTRPRQAANLYSPCN
jgi:hypothetical protein